MQKIFGLLGTGALLAALAWPDSAYAAERVHYIAAEEVEWDYAPLGHDEMMGKAFDEDQAIFVERRPGLIGKRYIKARYTAYTDDTFTTPMPITETWTHLGILGPVIHAEVGDTIRVVFKNMASRPYSVHPHGVFYTKAHEGVPYNDGTVGEDKADDAVPPGGNHTYIWQVPERAGPGPGDTSSIGWFYHSHVDEPKDTNTGLVGTIVVTAKGKARADGRPADVDREFVTLFSVVDENTSWYLERNRAKFTGSGEVDEDVFEESNLMHTINGYVFGNLPGLKMRENERVRWYVLSLGTEVDLHTPHWHGNTGLFASRRIDVLELMPASSKVVDMIPDNPGTWMYHCHVNDHIDAGMTALYHVGDGGK